MSTLIKKLLISLFIISALGVTSVTATRALLSDQAVLSTNTFSTGTADLRVSSSQSTNPSSFADQANGFNDKLLPGQTKEELFWLKNYSSDIDFSIAAQSASVSGEINPTDVTIAFTPVDDAGSTDVGPTVSHTLDVWNTPTSLGTTITHGTRQRYKMKVTLSSSVSSIGSIVFDFDFTGTQTP